MTNLLASSKILISKPFAVFICTLAILLDSSLEFTLVQLPLPFLRGDFLGDKSLLLDLNFILVRCFLKDWLPPSGAFTVLDGEASFQSLRRRGLPLANYSWTRSITVACCWYSALYSFR